MLQSVQLQRPFSPAGGHAFIAAIPEQVRPGIDAGSITVVAEDGNVLGPAGALHEHIRQRGGGAFSVWGKHVYVSASDSSDCNANGRDYSLLVIDIGDPSVRQELARNDAVVLDLVRRNRQFNNSVVGNFFTYFQGIEACLRRNGVARPRRVLELGAGKRPYSGLRFLAEGVETFVANDVQRIDRTLPSEFVRHLASMLDLYDPSAATQLLAAMEAVPGTGEVKMRGMQFADERPFETLDGPGDLDLIVSVSVLEHVAKPKQVVARMFELLRSGGHVWHSIDLRDHRDFDRPLDFLQMTAAEYASIDTENRLRASDWREVFLAAGFELVDQGFSTIAAGQTTAANETLVFELPAQPWVTESMRAGFRPPFDSKDLVDLSLLGVTLLCRKP